ncbi:hypothetical protein ADK75_35395 [Streptomyces virginiae]|uniref:Uncharacterized protein n=1 Tax=Streptomyces virginiae TaxID=1961 RepID=A0A0L8M2G9_STRVG|nr:hypothetical protein [Streptomyces virginiae]KOG44519.1 hypothetical protein ADK75_35395 [Streptomyces virginiae]
MNVSDRLSLPASRGQQPGRTRTAVLTVALLAGTLLGCSGGGHDPEARPTASYQESPPVRNGIETSQSTKDFHEYLASHEGSRYLTTVFIDVRIEGSGADLSGMIVTGLDQNLEDTGSPDLEKAKGLAKAFVAWRTEEFQDHGSVRVYNPALETMAAAAW